MSHCTTYPMVFQDKRLLFRAMRELEMEPESVAWEMYGSGLLKRLGIGGDSLGKLLTGSKYGLNLAFEETEEGLRPMFETDALFGEERARVEEQLLSEVETAYLRCAVEETAKKYRESGLYAEVREKQTEEGVSFVLNFGTGNKSVTVVKSPDGVIEERVQGVTGRSCTDATAPLERLLSNSNTPVERTWTPAYQANVEDRELKVLRLTR